MEWRRYFNYGDQWIKKLASYSFSGPCKIEPPVSFKALRSS
jgi:hypothetical protein